MLTLITRSTCCTYHYTYPDSGPASQSNMIISKNISTSSMAAYHDIFHQHHLICWWRSALTSGGVAHIWIYHLIILHCSWSWSNWVDLEIMRQMFYHVSAKIKQTWNLLRLTWPLVKNTFSLLRFFLRWQSVHFSSVWKKSEKSIFISKHLCFLVKLPDVKIYVFSVSFFCQNCNVIFKEYMSEIKK